MNLPPLPSDVDIEKSLLAGCILHPANIEEAVLYLQPEDLYQDAHKTIFQTLKQLHLANKTIDLPTLYNELKGSISAQEIAKIVDEPMALNIKQTCDNIKKFAILREVITQSYQNIKDCYENPDEALDLAQNRIMRITDDTGESFKPVGEVLPEVIDYLEKLNISDKKITGISSGFRLIDKLTCGFQKSDLIILAGRPGMGKTALGLNIAVNASFQNIPVLFFSLEMSKRQLLLRLLASETGIDGQKFRAGRLRKDDWMVITDVAGRIYEIPLIIDDSSLLTHQEIVRRTLKARKEHEIELVVIDYLQYIQGDNRLSENYKIAEVTKNLKGMAKNINIPVILLSQLNRKCEERPNPYKRPRLSDLRDSGALEQDADIVMFLYRPEVYDEKDDQGNDQAGIAEVCIAKHRNGPTGTVRLQWAKMITKFRNLRDEY